MSKILLQESKYFFVLWSLNLLLILCPNAQASPTEKLRGEISSYFKKNISQLGKDTKISFELVELPNGESVTELNSQELLIPASVLKLLVTYAALKNLGGEYHFKTKVYTDNNQNIYFKGEGDPSFVNEQAWILAQGLANRGLKVVKNLFVDDSSFVNPPRTTGSEPYQAGASATVVNYNSYSVEVAPNLTGQNPFVSLMPGIPYTLENLSQTVTGGINSIGILKKGSSIIVSGEIGQNAKPQVYYFAAEDPSSNYGSVVKWFLNSAGIKVEGKVINNSVPSTALLFYEHQSKELSDIVKDLNHYSNNFIAGQLLFVLGRDETGRFFLDQGIKNELQLLKNLGIQTNEIKIYDGSGLSTQNKLSTRVLVKLLIAAYNDFSIAPDYIASLSRFGRNGTLKKRLLRESAAAGVWAKTGSMTGVNSLAGYISANSSNRYAFAMLINGSIDKAKADLFGNKLIETILREG